MMIVCIELRIPMFLVGKPGSSKSLAKTIVADAMQGNAAHKDLFKNYKQVLQVEMKTFNKSLYIKDTFSGSLDCPLYTGLTMQKKNQFFIIQYLEICKFVCFF